MMRQARFSQLRSFSRSTTRIYPRRGGLGGLDEEGVESLSEKILDRTMIRILKPVATQAITQQNAVQRVMSLVKNATDDTRYGICQSLWRQSINQSRRSTEAASAVTNFLFDLSKESQENSVLHNEWGDPERLWCDMPLLWEEVDGIWDTRAGGMATPGPVRKSRIDRFLKDVYFTSLLFRSSQPEFDKFSRQLSRSFSEALEWPWYVGQWEERDVLIPAIVVQMSTVGDKLKEKVLQNPLDTSDHLTVGWWYRWQKRLLTVAADEMVNTELRATAKQAYGMMTIDKHLIDRWWRRWRKELSEIVADKTKDADSRATAKIISDILTVENECAERK